MAHFSCIIQRDQSAATCVAELEAGLHEIHAKHFADEPTTVSWRRLPPGDMFTEGKPSTSSIVSCVLGCATSLPEREAFLRAVCELWTSTTGCTDHEVVVAVTETEPLT